MEKEKYKKELDNLKRRQGRLINIDTEDEDVEVKAAEEKLDEDVEGGGDEE